MSTRATRLVHCFHHAGGGPEAFRRWPEQLPGMRVIPADLETTGGAEHATIGALAEHWRQSTSDRSGIYYGHSMGALVAFEAAVAAFADGDPHQVPSAVVLGSPPAPGGPGPAPALGPDHALSIRTVQGLERVRQYVPSRAVLPIPVHVLWGELDGVVDERDARAWTVRGSMGSGWHTLRHAGHLFHIAPGGDVSAVLRNVLGQEDTVEEAA
ncbi:thioesterase domain-containing protein [Promicromonospora sp. CA-289599]|uniref:alpha/beta fold hydrolase n=1 Tax=Promicromonospora sp. CA-289599 TaxID=3240014 RepID=UPI003D8D500A